MRKRGVQRLAAILLLLGGAAAWAPLAHAVPIGILSFDTFIPGPGGVNAFNITNLTGGFASPPHFPVVVPLTFTGSSLALVRGDGTPLPVIALGDIGPGSLLDPFGNPLASLQFPDSTSFLSATFTAFLTLDGVLFDVSATFVPTPRAFAELDARPAAVPEPPPWLLIAMGLAGLLALRGSAVRRRGFR